MGRVKAGVLVSGRGSNLQALIDATRASDFPVEIALVVSNRPDAQGLQRAEQAGIPTRVVDHKGFPDRSSFEAVMTAELEAAGVELVCHAGFMRILTTATVLRWEGRMINIHPSLLPAFPGLKTHQQALTAGVKLHGCTVHYVSEDLDAGPIIGQAAVPVMPGDTVDSLAARVLAVEHQLFPRCLSLIAQGRVRLVDGRSVIDGATAPVPHLINPAPLAAQEESR